MNRRAKDAARVRLEELAEGLSPRRTPLTPLEPVSANWRLDWRALRALAAVVVIALVVAVWTWWNGQPLPAEAVVGERPGAVSSSAPDSRASNALAAPAITAGEVVVDVVGDVANPGLFTLPAGSRIADAITAAGGATDSTTGVNLARVLVDGEQVVVGKSAAAAALAAGEPGKVSINVADLAALDALPGIGPVLAQRIIDWRTSKGPFATVEALSEVPGIGPSVFGKLKPLVTT